jgi:hypothetical protein
LHKLIKECKDFWKVTDFQKEILNWKFTVNPPKDLIFNIGHPIGSHKGPSIGDILPYTLLPRLIKEKYPDAIVNVPLHFAEIFKNNPYVDRLDGIPHMWGSLGTWGNTVQRACNVCGITTFKTSPEIYSNKIKDKNTIIFSVNSNAGGKLENLKILENAIEELKVNNYCVQIGLGSDRLLRNVNEYILNLNIPKLIDTIASCGTYIGIHNSLYHMSKALGLKVIGIVGKQYDPRLVVLPFLTQINYYELEMLQDKEKIRAKIWEEFARSQNIDPESSQILGWLYPDVTHLTDNLVGTKRCPSISVDNIKLALDNKIYPFSNPVFWELDTYKDEWG